MRRALGTAAFVGLLLTAINQYDAVFGEAGFSVVQMLITFVVPFCVSLFAARAGQDGGAARAAPPAPRPGATTRAPLGLRCRLCWKITVAVFVSIVVIEAAILVPSYVNYERDRLDAIHMAGRQAVTAALDGDSGQSLDGEVLERRLSGTLVQGFRLEANGRTLASGGEAIRGQPALDGSLRERRRRGDPGRMLVSWQPDALGDGHRMIASLGTETVDAELQGFLMRIAGLVLLITLFVTAVTMLVLQRMVLGPLLLLRRRIRSADRDEDNATARTPAVGADELQETISAFEAMLARNDEHVRTIAEREAEYRRLNAELDERVEQRTRELQAANDRLQHRAYHDPLTELPNRALFHDHLDQAINAPPDQRSCIAVMLIGLDSFASVNGLYGYTVGDQVLRTLATRLAEAAPSGHVVARFGGDVFAVLAPCSDGNATGEALEAVAERLQAVMQAPVTVAERTVECIASVGVSGINGGSVSAETMMGQADMALVHAKRDSSSRIQHFAESMNRTMQRRLELVGAMRRGLDNGEFELVYQPQCRADGVWTGLEALVRWQRPGEGAISPGTFIPLAEENGLIQSLGTDVLRQAVDQASRWYRVGHPLPVAVNISVGQLHDMSLVTEVRERLVESGLPPHLLELEVTESGLMRDLDHGTTVLEELSALGVRLAIDDFGTGYSSLAYLARLPVDRLKIDKSFIDAIPADARSTALCRAVIELGRVLGFAITAEGVETREQLDWLQAEGCHQIQGFYFARPASPEQLRWPAA